MYEVRDFHAAARNSRRARWGACDGHDSGGRADVAIVGTALDVYCPRPTRRASRSLSVAAPENERFAAVAGSR